MMLCLVITLIMYASWYCLCHGMAGLEQLHRVVCSFVLTTAQIVLTELVLGLAGRLVLANVVVVNLLLALVIFIISYRRGADRPGTILCTEVRLIRSFFSDSLDTYTGILLAMLFLTYSWVIVSAYFLPLRGVDDLVYHLPPVFEYIQSHTIKLLPVEIRPHFAFPQNAELLFLWPALFTHSQRMLDCVNVPFVIMSVVIVYALISTLDTHKKDSVFVSLLYGLCPVVIMQAGSNYIDVIVSLFIVLSLYLTVVYAKEKRDIYLYLAGLSMGLLCGMKYTALLVTLPFQLMIIASIRDRKLFRLIGFYAIILVSGGWWYVRNAVVLGNPVFPARLLSQGRDFTGGSRAAGMLGDVIQNVNYWVLRYPLEDIGIGSYDGGFGLVFWCFGFSSWLYMAGYSVVHLRTTDLTRLLVLIQLPLGFLMLLLVPQGDIFYVGRLSLFVVAVGLFALRKVLALIDDRAYTSMIKVSCIVFSVLTISLMAQSTMPTFRLGRVFADRRHHETPSEYKYIADSNGLFAMLRHIWEPLDYLTRDDKDGIRCYLAANWGLYYMAPIYGSDLQNRIVNLDKDARQAEAFVYSYLSEEDRFGKFHGRELLYLNTKIEMSDVVGSREHIVITQTDVGCLVMSTAYLMQHRKQALLKTYYKDTWPEAIVTAKRIQPYLRESLPLVTASEIAYGMKYLDLCSNVLDRVVLTEKGKEAPIAVKRDIRRCYTLEAPLNGYRSEKIASVADRNNRAVDLFVNER